MTKQMAIVTVEFPSAARPLTYPNVIRFGEDSDQIVVSFRIFLVDQRNVKFPIGNGGNDIEDRLICSGSVVPSVATCQFDNSRGG